MLSTDDVTAYPDDLLELPYQHSVPSADMTCAMGYIFGTDERLLFYESYIARGIKGDLVFEIPVRKPRRSH